MKRTESESEDGTATESKRETGTKGGSGSGRERADARADPVASLHRSVGNRAIQRSSRTGNLQPGVSVSEPDDGAEREADRVAESVTRSPEPAGGQRRSPAGLTDTVGPHRASTGGAGGVLVQRQPEDGASNGGGGSGVLGSIGESVSEGVRQAGEAVSEGVREAGEAVAWGAQKAVEVVQKDLFETPGVLVEDATVYESPPSNQGQGQGQGGGDGSGSETESSGESRQAGGSGGGSGSQSGGESVAEGDQVFVRRLTLVDGSPWYEVETRTSGGTAARYVRPESVMLWYGSVDTGPDEVRSKVDGEGTGGEGGPETGDEQQQPGAARERMVQLAQQKWKKGIEDFDVGDTHHDFDLGTAHVLGSLDSEIGTSDVADKVRITSARELEQNEAEMKSEGVKVAVTGVPESKADEELKQDIANILNIYVATGGSAVGDEYTGKVQKEHWCARFVGSLARSAGVQQEVLEQTLWSTTRAYEGSLEKSLRDETQVPTDTPPLKRVEGDPQPGDIVTVKQWNDGETYRGVDPGGHVTLAAGAPRNGYLPTIEGNGKGWHPSGEWTEGIVKRFRPMSGEDGAKQVYRLTKEHFEGGGKARHVREKAKNVGEDVAGSGGE